LHAFASNCGVPRIQLNVRLPDGLVEKARTDARRHGKTVDSIVETVLADFFKSFTLTERANFYAHQPAKRAGRPIGNDEKEVAS